MTDPDLLATFEARFAEDADPWKFETSDYEQRKRADTLRACGAFDGGRVLELGAANGVLAAELAERAGTVVAIEAVHAAADLAVQRLATAPDATVVEGLIPVDVPAGPYDLIVASEILYYLDAAAYQRTLHSLQTWLAPGGRLVAVHWRPDGPERPRGAADVHTDLAALPFLELLQLREHDEYLLSVLRRRGSADPGVREAWVAVPARDEADGIADAVKAVSAAASNVPGATHLVIVDDGSSDSTASVAKSTTGAWRHGTACVLSGPGCGAGWARRTGLDHALHLADTAGDPRALIATTDADSTVPANWLARLHALADAGHQVIAGDIALGAGVHPEVSEARDRRLAIRLAAVREHDPRAEHPHFAGGNLAWTARTLAALQPLPTPRALEDDALRARCEDLGISILRDASFPVVTSPRLAGRAEAGLATALAADARALGISPARGPRGHDSGRVD